MIITKRIRLIFYYLLLMNKCRRFTIDDLRFRFFLLLQILLNFIIKRFAILFCLLNENRDTKRKKKRNE